jgi:outer membrane lipoprotein-sorting protein
MRGFAVAALGLSAALAAGETPTAEELVAKNLQARGGLEKIRAVQSMRMTGSMRLGPEKLPTVLELKRPSKARWEFTLEGQTAVQAFDGKTAWAVMPFAGQVEPRIMTDAETRDIELQADMDGPLVDAAAKGNTIELVGKETIEGEGEGKGGIEAWRLRITRKNGDSRDLYLDAKTYLQVMTVSRRSVDGRPIEIKSRIGDYRKVGGLMLPHSYSASTPDVDETQSLEFDKIEIDVTIDDSRFAMPKAAKTEAPATGGGL